MDSKILPIRIWDDPVLSTVCENYAENEFGPELVQLGQDMIATMKDPSRSTVGVGLAAPQVGILKRMFVMLTNVGEKNEGTLVVCNPVINYVGEKNVSGDEGCLSFPDIYEQVMRYPKVDLMFREPNGQPRAMSLNGFDARIAQHEYDHLDGIMFFQRISKQMRKQVLRQWEKKHGSS